MGATLDSNVSVSVLTTGAAPGKATFTVPMFVGVQGALFTERHRAFQNAAEVAADTDVGAPSLALVTDGFSQSPTVNEIKIGRAVSAAPQTVDWTMAAGPVVTTGETYTITYNDIVTTVTMTAADTAADVATDLQAALTISLGAEPVVVAGAASHVLLTASTINDPFQYDDDSSVDAQVTISAPAVAHGVANWGTELTAILAENEDWFAFDIESRQAADLTQAAAWAEANNRLFLGQTSDQNVLAGTGIVDTFAGVGYEQAGLIWKNKDIEPGAFGWLCKKLACDPDSCSTFWSYCRVTGATSDTDNMTTAEKNTILGNFGNVYIDFKGIAVTGMGTVAAGIKIDTIIAKLWLEARIQETIANGLIQYSNLNTKVPYTDAGIAIVQGWVQEYLQIGLEVGHIAPFTDDGGGYQITVPKLSEVSTADRTNRLLRITFVAELAGAIENVTVNGSLLVSI